MQGSEICSQGWSGDGPFEYAIRVPYADVDQMAVVYYANYLVYFEMARSSMLREAGLSYGDMEKRGVLMPVVAAHCEYKASARFEDLLVVRCRCSALRRTRLRVDYEVMRGRELLVLGYTEHICMSRSGKVSRLLPELRALVDRGAKGKHE